MTNQNNQNAVTRLLEAKEYKTMIELNPKWTELIQAGDDLSEAVDTLKIRMSCQNCEGDGLGWLCAGCESAYAAAERAQDAWFIAKANATD